MHHVKLIKPDGRALHLYSRSAIDEAIEAPSPFLRDKKPNPHLRWHPLRAEWVAYASHRQERTFLPPAEFNPLAAIRSSEYPTELPQGDYEVAVFENLFPSLSLFSEASPVLPVPTRPAHGICEVVVFTQNASESLATMDLGRIELIIDVWADRVRELGAREEIQYVMPFENRGVEMGVTLHHPHGQIYAYPVIPPIPARELAEQKRFLDANGRGLLVDLLEKEITEKIRVIYNDSQIVALVPPFARYPYEVWIAPLREVGSIVDLSREEKASLARALKTVLMKYDGLWGTPMPYLMVFHQAPVDGKPHPEAHFHIELYPPYRMKGRLKYLAGTELGAGLYANDSLPEEKAAELKAVEVTLG